MEAEAEALPHDVEERLTSMGIEKRQLIPTNIAQKAFRQQQQQEQQAAFNQFTNGINILPLEWFAGNDDCEFSIDGAGRTEGEKKSVCLIGIDIVHQHDCCDLYISLLVCPKDLPFCLIHRQSNGSN